ncbi:transcriptional regulator MalT [Actinomadura rubteroloni]|uniref:Transcriptional regulator MalT n=1 Tax=Actinomadura rubteroloni TaxID=1926885 RepID=A0A2P4UHN2_9ACTN|nr:LuxR family transcriptional regulator [Actinomadura rubteroloni]POM24536.1 transcriptional regulator MalT [Actinomadura rubteroloni]
MEREAEFRVLSSLLSDALRGKGGAALVTGPAGYGKTTLLRAFGGAAAARGAVFLSATATRTDNDPWELFDQILRHPAIPSTVPGALSHDLAEGGDRTLSAAQLHEIWKPVQELARDTPVVIAVDDAHHADDTALRGLLYLSRRLEAAPIVVVAALSSCPLDERALFSAEMSSQPHCRHVQLGPLSAADVADMVADDHGPEAAEFDRLSGGNPLLLGALIEDARDRGASARPGSIAGDHYVKAVWRFLHRGHPALVALAQAVAVLGEAGSPALLGETLAIDPMVAAQGLNTLEAGGLVDAAGFRDERARDALYAKVPARERTKMLLRAAAVLQQEGAPALRVARLLAAADDIGEPWMVGVLRNAADQEQRDGDFPCAVRYLRLARQAVARGSAEEAQITSDLAAVEWQLDPLSVVRLLPDLEAAAWAGHLRSDQTENLVTYLLWHGQREKAITHLTDREGNVRPTGWTSRFRSWLYPALLTGVGGAPADERSVEVAVIGGARIDDDILIAAEQALLNTRLDDSALVPALTALAVLVYTERLDRAGVWIDTLLKAADRRGSVTWRALVSTANSLIDVRRGVLRSATTHANRALSLISHRSWGMAIGLPLSSALDAATGRGRHDIAASLLTVPLPDGIFNTLSGLYYMHARGCHHAAIGRHMTALADFDSCGDLMREWEIDQPALIPWRSDAALAGLRLGRTAYARSLLAEQDELTQPWDMRTRAATLRVRALLAEGRDRVALLTEATTTAEQTADLVGLATGLVDLSRAQRTVGDTDAARTTGLRAQLLIEQSGLEALARQLPRDVLTAKKTRAERKPKPPQPAPSTRELSDAEQRVASLAAAGFSNREIASELFITVSTVEQHLTRVYRKLKVTRRPLLAKALNSHA